MAADCSGCSGYDYNDKDWGKQIRCLRCEITTLRGEIQGMSSDVSNFSSQLGKSNQIFGDMLSTIGEMRKRMWEFSKSTSQQYELAEKIAEAYKEVGLNIGLSVERSKGFSKAFKGSVAEIARFGGTIDDAKRIYEEFAESSGRVRILGKDEVKNIFQLGKASNLLANESASLYETLDLMGVGYENATIHLENIIKDSQNIGLNSSKVMKVLSNNMNKMQTYSFANGVKGMTQMSKLAVKMRMDVSEMLGMADKFYEPEAAIEAAANLQMLGGDIATAFGDPFETMYLARNKPEELAAKVGDMVEGMMTFNEETKQYDFPAEARMQLKAAGDQLGINVDSMVEMARQSAKIGDVKDKLTMDNPIFSEEEMESIGSMARMSKDGGFVVDIYDENGEKQTKAIEELNSGELKMLVQPPKDEQDYMEKMIDNSMTTNQLLKSIEDTFQKSFIEGFDVYQLLEDGSKKTIIATRNMTQKSLEAAVETWKKTIAAEAGALGKEQLKATDQAMADYIDNLGNFLEESPDTTFDIEDGIINIMGVSNFNPSGGSGGGGGATDYNPSTPATEEYCKSVGRGYDPGPPPKCIPSFKTGGVVTKPMNALIGDGGEPEVIFPLSKLENFINSNNSSNVINKHEGNATLNVVFSGNIPDGMNTKENKDLIAKEIIKLGSNGFMADGNSVPRDGGVNALQSRE
tara:strand:+ start:9711 stop:11780 length:2070 start_codon:yes stop_codon:yes gene_type:complete